MKQAHKSKTAFVGYDNFVRTPPSATQIEKELKWRRSRSEFQ